MTESHDLCPMCNGSGKHDLRPPDGQIYLLVEGKSRNEWTPSTAEDLMVAINEAANKGYELMKFIVDPNRASPRALMKWRWV